MENSLDTSVPDFSVVVPVRNEADNISPLIAELKTVMTALQPYEIVIVDDGSDDATPEVLRDQARACPELRVIRHRSSVGQSAAITTGVNEARAGIIITLDGDGQNDPADIPALLDRFREADNPDLLLVTGERQKRRDSLLKRLSSRVANAVRGTLLGDHTPDTGCGLKVFSRPAYLAMPGFDHMHRFLPALMLCQGGHVLSVPVNHRARQHGATKYGVFDRLGVGIVDLFGVMWLQRRPGTPVPGNAEGSGFIDRLGARWLKRRAVAPEIDQGAGEEAGS
ncbi:MAG TPA: glycosyltransferase [Rhodospirillales bacterium]|nr:glycosyltransferase [Rhodospirillales bacterium]